MATGEIVQRECVLFAGTELIARGGASTIAVLAKRRQDNGETSGRVYLDHSGLRIDLDLSGDESEVVARLSEHPALGGPISKAAKRGPGRPKLGVTSREVSLLPRHWEWLGEQSGGASAALRRLVDAARKGSDGNSEARQAVEAAHRFLWDAAGDLPGFESASRALFAYDFTSFEQLVASWPKGIREQTMRYIGRAKHRPAAE